MRRSFLFAAFLPIASITVQIQKATDSKAFGESDLLPGSGIIVFPAFSDDALLTASYRAHAQEGAAATQGRWLPREVRPFSNINAEQEAAAIGTLDRIERILKQVPELANPDGYEILPIISGGGRQRGPDGRELPGTVVEYRLSLVHFHPTRAIAGEGGICISVIVNGPQSGRILDAEGREIYIEGDRGKPSTNPNISDSRVPQKATQVYGDLWNVPGERSIADVLFVTAGELPWKPVSREEFYRASLFELEGANGEKLAEYREGLKKTPYQQWMEGAAQRKADREAAMAQLKGILPDSAIEEMRQTQETTEREVTENLKKDEAMHREQNTEALASSFARRDSMEAELARMTPEERRLPTYINNALDSGPMATGWRLTADSAPPAWRVLTPNYDFYRARRSPVEVRSIDVHLSMAFTCLAPEIQHMLWQAYHTLDWAAFNHLLETPR